MNPMQGNVQQNPSRRYVVIQEPYEMPPHFLRLVFITILSQWKDDDPGLVVTHTGMEGCSELWQTRKELIPMGQDMDHTNQ